ncbi:hypothetical protein XU18_3905 [Perkinsela sp. CCAP 1560/4]|nr:hypothetical protein XU18_3905 [Perkinsela sp. CCAP 1560/4]|eukprot:KNH04976.1 hypothetical protein XU18_3905 [Perkinsela sp. CCAP 1560/4]
MVERRSIGERLHGSIRLRNFRVEFANVAGRREASSDNVTLKTATKRRQQEALVGEEFHLFSRRGQVCLEQRIIRVRCCRQSTCQSGAARLNAVHGGHVCKRRYAKPYWTSVAHIRRDECEIEASYHVA